tara:strand:+ start:265 stop:528 length:264 start_codon:yes stop_codon:yes gene_type:complete
MPIYRYECKSCKEVSSYMHGYDEVRLDCEKCESKNTLVKILGKPLISKNKNKEDSSVGEITNKFIEENREILNKQKKEYSNKQYDKS